MPHRMDESRTVAAQYIAQRRFHRRFMLPKTTSHDQIPITYADVGIEPDALSAPVPTFLFMPGMFGSRYVSVYMHAIAEKLGVRVLVVDRPGMGGSAPVPRESRVKIWIETVPLLLKHLSIDHVSLVSHSAGTVYLFNTLAFCREILNPEHPFVACLAPWVDPARSHMTVWQLARFIPTRAFSFWNQIPRFFQTSPLIASSGAVISGIKDKLPNDRDGNIAETKKRLIEQEYGLTREVQTELEKFVARFIFEEQTTGANEEALQCLRKGAPWGVCDNYADFIKSFVQQERNREPQPPTNCKLTVKAYFAESDSMIGKRGQSYFEQCFQGFEETILFDSSTVMGEDHDSLCFSPEILAKIFKEGKTALNN